MSGAIINGNATITMSELTGSLSNGSPLEIKMAIQLANFSAGSTSENGIFDGDMTVNIEKTNSANHSVGISGAYLHAVSKRNGVTQSDRTLDSYDLTTTYAGQNSALRASDSLSGSSIALNGMNVTVKTAQSLVYAGTDPSTGSMVITGAVSSVILTAVDSGNVRLDFSATGNGVVTESKTMTWAQLKTSI